MKIKLILLMHIFYVIPIIAQKLGVNTSFRVRYNMMESQNFRSQTTKGAAINTTIEYDKESGCVVINSNGKSQELQVRNFRKEYVGDVLMNCMNVIQNDVFGYREDVIGAIWWDEKRFILHSLGNEKIIIFYNKQLE